MIIAPESFPQSVIWRRQYCNTVWQAWVSNSLFFSSDQSDKNKKKIRAGCVDWSIKLEVNKYFVCVSAEQWPTLNSVIINICPSKSSILESTGLVLSGHFLPIPHFPFHACLLFAHFDKFSSNFFLWSGQNLSSLWYFMMIKISNDWTLVLLMSGDICIKSLKSLTDFDKVCVLLKLSLLPSIHQSLWGYQGFT